MIGIYKITNNINNKAYIGQSINIENRWIDHKKRANQKRYQQLPLYRAMLKYGITNFKFEIIEECDKISLNEREIYWIEYFNTFNQQFGYNLTKGGENGGHDVSLNDKQTLEIIDRLLNTIDTQQDIANDFNVNQSMISRINSGQYRQQQNLQYPLRKSNDKQTICIDCGIEIFKESNRCNSCNYINRRIVERPSRNQLKTEIRTTSFIQLGKKYGVSDNAIRKWCVNYKLPKTKKEINAYSDIEWNDI